MSVNLSPQIQLLRMYDVSALNSLAEIGANIISTRSQAMILGYRFVYGLETIKDIGKTAINLVGFLFYSMMHFFSSSYTLEKDTFWSHTSLSVQSSMIALWGALISPYGAAEKTCVTLKNIYDDTLKGVGFDNATRKKFDLNSGLFLTFWSRLHASRLFFDYQEVLEEPANKKEGHPTSAAEKQPPSTDPIITSQETPPSTPPNLVSKPVKVEEQA